MANIARLGVVLGLDSAEFQAGLKSAEQKASEFASNVGTKIMAVSAMAVGAFGAMVAKSLAYADQMSDTAKANDIGIGKILQLSAALAANGGESDNAGKMLSSLSTKINEAAQGGLAAQNSFAKVGVSLKDIGNMTTEQLMQKTLDGLAKVGDAATRNAEGLAVFGKAAKGVDFGVGGMADAMSASTAEFDKHAKAVEIAGNFHDMLQARATATTLKFTSGLFPALQDIANAFSDDKKKGGEFVDTVQVMDTAVRGLALGVMEVAHWFAVAGDGMGAMAAIAGAVAHGDLKLAEEINKQWDESTKASVKSHEESVQQILHGSQVAADAIKSTASGGPLRTTTVAENPKTKAADAAAQKVREELRLAKDISNGYDDQLTKMLKKTSEQSLMVSMTADEKALMTAMIAIDDTRIAKLDEIQKKIDKEKGKDKKNDKTYSPEVIAELEKQKKAVMDLSDTYKQMSSDQIVSQQAAQKTFTFGWDKSFRQYAEDSTNYAKMGEQAFTSVTGNMTKAIDTFVQTGKINFKDLAGSIIKDLVSIQLKMSAMDLFKSVAGTGGGVMGGLGGLLSSVMGGGAASAATDTSVAGWAASAGITAHANGGTISSDAPVLVGERGPELFVPGRSGAVIPTNDMSAIGSSSGTVYNGPYIENMSAIDTQSAAQFLSNNKMTIFAANQSASRSLPMSR